MSHITFFLPTLKGGGAERNVVNLVNNLDRRKYKISLVLGKAEGVFINEIPEEVSINDFNLNTSYSLGLFFNLIRYFRKEQPDIFISAFPRFNIISIIARIFSRVKTKIIITEHTTFSLLPFTARIFSHKLIARFPLPYLVRFFYPRADAIICVSKGIAEDLSKMIYKNKGAKLKVVYNPITDNRICQLAEEPLSHPWFSSLEIPVILAAGRLSGTKDYPNLLKAFKKVLQNQGAKLIILGEGSEENKLKQLAYELGLSDNVAFLGFQQNLYKYMKRARIFVLSSFQEGFGNVIVEAMACGIPVVSTNCISGPREIIENGKNGILVPVGDQEALAKAILKVLNNWSLAHKLSEQGKKRAEYFSIEKSVKKYEEIFDNL